jgi:glycosyltransferase involved in cell wall biosynthesis
MWARALRSLGHDVQSTDRCVSGTDNDLLVVHDPLMLDDPPADADIVRWRDLPGQRRDLERSWDVDRFRTALHVTPTLHARRELEARGIERVECLPDAFDLDPPMGDRDRTRAWLGFEADDIVVLQPTVVAARKNPAGAVRYVNELAKLIRNRPLRLWIKGPIDDDHAELFAKVVDRCSVPVTVQEASTAADAYAACDTVIFPAPADAFGDVILEGVAHRRPVVSSEFPVLSELIAGGIRPLPIDDPAALVKFLGQRESSRRTHLDATARRARVSYSQDDFAGRVAELIARVAP